MKKSVKVRKHVQFNVPKGSSLFDWDNFAFVFFVIAIIGTFIFELLIVCKTIYPKQSIWPKIHWIMGCFILHNIMGNFVMIIYYKSTIKGKLIQSSSSTINRGHVCFTCESTSPARSYHCSNCNVCILKRDHHCTFARTCIGYFNYRYFISLIMHIFIGSLYATTLNMMYIWKLLGGFNLINLCAHTFPFIFWMFGKLPFYQTFCCIISVINIAASFFTLGLLFYYGSMVIVNQTVFERSRGITGYNLGSIKLNLEQSLGECWYLIWLSPMIPSKLPGNGLEFITIRDVQLNSSKNK